MSVIDRFIGSFKSGPRTRVTPMLPGESPARHSERGMRTTPDEQMELMYQTLSPSYAFRAVLQDLRDMDRRDGRVKRIHERTARAACKGGLMLNVDPKAKRVLSLWSDFQRRLELSRREKLESDMRGLMMEGNLPIQWIVDLDARVIGAGVRMPTETLKPIVNAAGRFIDPQRAFEQWDWLGGKVITTFPLWQLMMVRLRPDNYDNWGCFGRPYLDATRTVWRQLVMTEKDLVVRRHMRAPQRYSHVLEGASPEDLTKYENDHKSKLGSITTDFYQNRKGGVTAIQGDANLDQIADVAHLLDTFFAGAPAPKGLFGYAGDLSRDILEDLKRDYYDELDAMQDTGSFIYEMGFRLQLLLEGINPDEHEMWVSYAERRTETPNQRADLALKHQALGVPDTLVFRAAGLDPAEVRTHLEAQRTERDAYPSPLQIGPPAKQRVSITPGNARKGESATSVSNQ